MEVNMRRKSILWLVTLVSELANCIIVRNLLCNVGERLIEGFIGVLNCCADKLSFPNHKIPVFK